MTLRAAVLMIAIVLCPGGACEMAAPLLGLTVIVPAAGDRPTTFRQREGLVGRDRGRERYPRRSSMRRAS